MDIGSLELMAGSATAVPKAPPRCRTEFSVRKILYLASVLSLSVASLFLSAPAFGQEERPQITPGERKTPRKKDAGPRAVAVLQLTSNGKASLLPVAILVGGKFYDAAAYKADPVPMALESGTVYEGERAGNSLGLFTVNSALKANAKNADTPWLGTGVWLPKGTEAPSQGIKAEAAPLGLSNADEPPRLSKNPDAAKPTPSGNTPPLADSKSSAPAAPSGDEPPRLNRPADQPSATTGTGTTQGGATPTPKQTAPDSAPDAKSPTNKPSDTKSSDSKPDVPTSDSGAGFGNRPRLRRGKPVESFVDESVPGYSKPGARSSAADSGKVVATAASTGPIQFVPAISDAGGPEPRTYTFEWIKGEEEDRRKQMMDMAKEQLRVYLAAHSPSQAPVPTATRAKSASSARKLPEPIFGSVQMIAYDLWTSNQPVIIFSADAHLPPPAAGTPQSGVQNELQYSIVLVAYPDTYGNLRKIYSGVTDKFHLDITPRLELIDAIDADGDGRGELLFRETTDAATGWIIYRATADKLYKLFDSVNPE